MCAHAARISSPVVFRFSKNPDAASSAFLLSFHLPIHISLRPVTNLAPTRLSSPKPQTLKTRALNPKSHTLSPADWVHSDRQQERIQGIFGSFGGKEEGVGGVEQRESPQGVERRIYTHRAGG